MVASPYPLRAVRSGEEGLDLLARQIPNQLFVLTLTGDGQHPGSDRHAVGLPQGYEPKERPQGGEANVAGPDPVAALLFQSVEKGENRRGVEIGHTQGCRLDTPRVLHEVQQEPEGVATARDRLWAETFVLREMFNEEGLDRRRDEGRCRGHGINWVITEVCV